MDENIKLPEPVAYRWRVGEHPWYFIAEPLSPRPLMETQALYTADQLRAAVEADRARRQPGQPVAFVKPAAQQKGGAA